jgi:hypothetical protein
MDWSTPTALAWSAVKGELARSPYSVKHSIGHVNVEVDCGERKILTGMTNSEIGADTRALLKEKIGLGVLFRDFAGKLESSDEVQAQLPERLRGGAMSHLHVMISDATCGRLMRFYDEFKDQGGDRHYGLPNRPRVVGEGAGCTAFGTAFLELGGLLLPEMHERWSKTIRVPVDLIGGGEAGVPKRRVSVLRLLFSFWRKWATEDQQHRSLHFWDPDAMHLWVKEVFQSNRNDFGRISMDNTVGLTWDARSVATPQEPIWLYP